MATAVLEAPSLAAPDPRKLWTRKEYRHLIEIGVLEDGKVELVNGEIWQKMGQGRRHTASVFGMLRLQTQSSLPVAEYGDPEPDVAVMAQTLDKYIEEEQLTLDNMLLVVEVSDSTLRADLTGKVRQYGSAGIPEYWVADIPNRLLHVFREPTEGGYASEIVLTPEDEVRPLAAPEATVRVSDLLP